MTGRVQVDENRSTYAGFAIRLGNLWLLYHQIDIKRAVVAMLRCYDTIILRPEVTSSVVAFARIVRNL